MVRRLLDYRGMFGVDEPVVWILAPEANRATPAGDTRRGTAWIFRRQSDAERFGEWVLERHGLQAVPVAVRLRLLAATLSRGDVTWVLDPLPQAGYGRPRSFKAPLPD